ncbi:MAG: dihydroneopterin aldolase [Candidatus Thermoplasmatota archaeon]|nr:dihydroneopterin aldolase [Candidatus Thermoplasmatota archaeon]MDP7265319.1 dihydroneopterin aldolase [Candidatus Thermoplasmatota archaeon]
MPDRITLKNMAFYGFHGTNAHETELGQRFFIDVDMLLNLREGVATDELDKTVNYKSVYEDIKSIVETSRFHLLESLAHNIARMILTGYELDRIIIRIRKPSVPLQGILDYVEVEIDRCREDILG